MQIKNTHNTSINCSVVSYNKIYSTVYSFLLFFGFQFFFIKTLFQSHYLLFGKGFETWEYSPKYALRSYTYLLIHVVPAWLYHQLLQPNRLLIFYFSRCLLGLLCAFCEVYFYK